MSRCCCTILVVDDDDDMRKMRLKMKMMKRLKGILTLTRG